MLWSTSNKEGSSATKNGGGENQQPEKGGTAEGGGGSGGGNKSSSVVSSSSASSFASNTAAAVASSPRAAATAVGAMTAAMTNKAKTMVKEVKDAVQETIEETNDFESEEMFYHSDEEFEVELGGRTSISNPSYRSRNNNKKVKFHVQSYLVDHHSLMVPSSTVRFRPGSSPSTGGQRMSVITNTATEAAAATAAAAVNHNNIGTIDEEEEEEEQSPSSVGRAADVATTTTTAPPPTHGSAGANAETFHTASRVIEDSSTQIILEERYDQVTRERKVIVKRVNTGSKGLQLLRILYALVCALWLGIFFAVAVQLLLNMVLDLSIVSGQTSINGNLVAWKAIGIILGLVQVTVSLAEGLVIGTRFVLDAWGGHHVIRELFFLRRDLVFVDWMYFWFVLGIPLCVLIGCLFARSDVFLEITGITWFSSISIIFACFALYTIWYEVRGAFNFVKNDLERKSAVEDTVPPGEEGGSNLDANNDPQRMPSVKDLTSSDNPKSKFSFWYVLRTAILMRQVRRYSGKERHRYLAKSLVDATGMDGDMYKSDIVGSSFVKRIAVFSRMSQWDFFTKTIPLFTKLQIPKKMFSLSDAQGTRPFLTKWTWSLEKVFCFPQSSSTVAIIDGPGALTRRQIRSTLTIKVLGMTMCVLLVISTLTWFEFGPGLIAAASVLLFAIVILHLLRVRNESQLVLSLKAYKDALTKEGDEDPEYGDESDNEKYQLKTKIERRTFVNRNAGKYIKGMNTGVYIVIQHYRLTQANPWLCWIMMGVEVILFWVWPAVALWVNLDYTVASLFTFIVLISGVRHYLNIATVIQETGRMDLTATGKSRSERWAHMSRLTTILQSVSIDKVKWVWTAILAFMGCAFVFLYFAGVSSDQSTESTSIRQFTFLPPDFYYPPQPKDIRYPTCSIAKAEQLGIENEKLYDFAFLSSLVYRTDDVMDAQLSQYFVNDESIFNVTIERDYVDDWRTENGSQDVAVKFDLFRITSKTTSRTIGIIAIRGSAKPWDWLVNNQLWQAAMVVQGVRALLPIGGVFTPFLDKLVTFINSFQSSLITQVSYYKTVTPFAEYVRSDPDYDGVILTGHSLGGGIAIISSAQSEIPAIAVSGPNAMLSRGSFSPPISKEALNRHTFNVVPDRDMVPRFDDLAQNYQRIRCLGPLNSPFSCHDVLLAFCELMYNCGSQDRVVPCECVTVYNYDQPLNNGTESFDELCANSGSPELGW
mmetsp:Transcript_31902/g.77500  ORF Transcript_31902/g.77500 Transcript_31902/m.77500 type:complete len:1216 (+) Transcript_31902:130-3777(+)